jgi:hypothetical protein
MQHSTSLGELKAKQYNCKRSRDELGISFAGVDRSYHALNITTYWKNKSQGSASHADANILFRSVKSR